MLPRSSTNKDKAFFASIELIDTPDPMTLVLKFKQPSFEALYHLGMDTAVILDEKSATTESTNPVGTGPYKLSSWEKGSSIVLDKWDGFRDAAKIPLAHATFRFISDPSAAVAAMLAGDVDAFPRFANVQALGQFKSDPRFQVLVGGTEGKTILAMNNKKKPLDDVRVRQAIAYALDRKAIIDGAMDGLGTPIGSHMTPNDPGYVDLTGMYPHDPEKAKALLKEAEVTTPLELSLILPPPPYARQGGEIIAAELAEIGINVKIQDVEWAQWLSGVYKDKNYDLTMISHVEPLDIGIYANPNYYFQYDSPAFRAIYEKVTSAPIRGIQGGARRSAKEARRGQRQRVLVSVAERDRRRREAQGPVEERANLRQRSLDNGVAMTRHARTAKAVSTQPFRMSALEMLRLYRTRELSPVEAMTSVIERVEAFEPHIHATYLYAPERALKEARASEARWAKGDPIGPLDGVPATVKDNIATKGEPKPVGTAAEDLSPQKADAPPAQRLREAGAIIFTKTTMPDYGMLTSGLSSFHPLARNPWNSTAIRVDRRRAQARQRRRFMDRCTSAPISAARCACRRAFAEFSASSRAADGSRSIRPAPAVSPVR